MILTCSRGETTDLSNKPILINACRTEGILEANAQPGELKFCSEYTETGNGETSQEKQHGFSQESLISFPSFNGEDFDRGQKR